MKPIPHSIRGNIFVALSGTLFGCLGYLGTQLIDMNLSLENMLFWRFLFASLFMLPSIVLLKQMLTTHKTEQITLVRTLLFGIILYTANSSLYFLGSHYIGTGLAMVVFFCFPVFVTLLMWLFGGWKANIYAISALIAVGIGLLFLKGYGDETIDMMGVFFSIMGALGYALYIFINRHHAKTIDTRLLTLFVCIGNTLLFFLWALFTQSFFIPTTWEAWFYILAIGIIATALPIRFMLDGMKYVSPIKASILSVLEPIVTLGIGFLLLEERVSVLQLIGIGIILIGAIAIQFERNSTN